MQIYKLQVKVDDHVGDIFSLPCVSSVIKDEATGTPMYQLKYVKDEATGMLRNYALPGDTLAQTIQGYWYVIRQKD
jgi:hypothetical protein